MSSESPTPLYSGTYPRSMDAKKRVSIPSAWVGAEESTFHVIPHPTEGYLMVMPPVEFDRWEQRIQASNASPADKRRAVRKFYSEAHAVTTDKQGRILLPEGHCSRATLKSDVVFVGAGSRFEIWAKERYEAVEAEDNAVYMQVAGEIGL
jgi:MraZ protein